MPRQAPCGPLTPGRLADWVQPLAHRAYRLMSPGSVTSSLGDALVTIAVVFAVLHIGGTATEVGLVVETVPAPLLQQPNSLLGLPGSLFSVGGPAVAGVLIALFGPEPLFAVDAATFVVSALGLARLRRLRLGRHLRVVGRRGGGRRAAGAQFKPRRPLVVGNLLLTLIAVPMAALAFSGSVALIAVAAALSGLGLIARPRG